MKRSAICCLVWLFFASDTLSAETVLLTGLDVDIFQVGNTCSHHAAYRLLRFGYGYGVTYQGLINQLGFIGETTLHVNVLPFVTVDIDLNLSDVGLPPASFADTLNKDGYPTAAAEVASIDRIKDLLWNGIPIIIHSEIGHQRADVPSFVADFYYPLLHYWVANGYDDTFVYLKSWDNVQRRITWPDFEALRAYQADVADDGAGGLISVRSWNGNNVLGLGALAAAGAPAGAIVHFNRPLDSSRILRTGERYPRLDVSTRQRGGAKVTSVDGFIDCGSTCSHTYKAGDTVTLKLTNIPAHAKLVRWTECTASATDTCSFTITRTVQVTPVLRCAGCGDSDLPVRNLLRGTSGSAGTPPSTAPGTLTVSEFYHPTFNHYFMTADAPEIALLAAGGLPPWASTGRSFLAWRGSGTALGSAVAPMCRFFSNSSLSTQTSSHFYSWQPSECPTLPPATAPYWTLESPAAFYVLPFAGSCPIGSTALFRFYNNGAGGAPNHRYTTSPTVRATMVQGGWISEGVGVNGEFACVPGDASP